MSAKHPLAEGARYIGFGVEFAGIIVAALLIGYYLDDFLGTGPLMMLLLIGGGMVGALRRLLWALKKNSSRRSPE